MPLLPPGVIIRIWTNVDGSGAAQQFTVQADGTIAGMLDISGDGVDAVSGSRKCLVRAYAGKTQIAADAPVLLWRQNRITGPLALGFLVRGKVAIGGRPPVDSGMVEVIVGTGATWAEVLAKAPLLEGGRFFLTCATGPAGELPAAITVRYPSDPAAGTVQLSRSVERPGPEIEVDLIVATPPSPTPPEPFILRGGLAYENREGLGETVELRIVLDHLGAHRVLETRSVATAARYEIELAGPLPPGDLALEVHMPDSAGRTSTRLATSTRLVSPVSPLEVDMLIGDPARTLPHFESIMARIAPHLAGVALIGLRDEQWAVLADAARLSEAERSRLRRAAGLAGELAEHAGGDPVRLLPAFFVLASGAPGESLAALLADSDEAQAARLGAAREAGEIGPEPWRVVQGESVANVTFAEYLKAKGSAAAQRLLFDPNAEEAPVAARLAALGVSTIAKRRHVMTLIEGNADLDAFRAEVLASPVLGDGEKARVIAVQSAASMAEFQAPLVAALSDPKARHPLTEPASVAAYRPDELAELIRSTDTLPSRYAGAGDPAMAYAQAIVERSFAEFQTGAFLARMGAAPSLPPVAALAVETLRGHPDFNLYATPVEDHFAAAGPGGVANPDRVLLDKSRFDALQTAQRLSRLTSAAFAPDAVIGLTAMGIGSAHDLVAMGAVRFNDAAQAQGWDQDLTRTILAGARAVSQITDLFFEAGIRPDYRLGADSMFGNRTETFPKLGDLFGSFDSCACVECRSVYSPSAYLTELLSWLEREFVHSGGMSGYAKLMERRADIAHLELTCENSHTLLPHIDLILETLEYVASQSLDLSAAAHQTDWRTPALLRDGEHFGATEMPAYQNGRLLDAVYPWSLPYNLWLDQMRAYLGAIGVKRADLVALVDGLRPWDPDSGLAAEILGMSDLQFRIVTGQHVPSGGGVGYWGGVNIVGKPVGEILRLSGLAYESLLDILRTEYVRHAAGAPAIFSIVFDPNDPCDLAKAHVSPPLAPPHADHIHRLERLRDCLGWSYWEVDEAIIALAAPASTADPLDAACLARLAGLRSLERDTRRPVAELIAWFGRIPAYRGEAASPFYEAELLSRAGSAQAVGLIGLAAAPDVPDRQLADPRPLAGFTAGERDQLRECLAMSQADFDAAAESMGEFILDLDALTWLYRLNSIARAAQMSVADLAAVASVAPLPTVWTPQTALRFLDFARWLGTSELSWNALHYYLTGDRDRDSEGLALAVDDLARAADQLYGPGGRFHALLSDPPVAASGAEVDRIDRLFAGVVATLASADAAARLSAVAVGDRSKFASATAAAQFVDSLFPTQAANPSWGFKISDAIKHNGYPRAAGSAALSSDPLLKTEAEVKAALAAHMAPEILRRSLREAALTAYSDLFQIPPDKVAFLLESVRSPLLPPGATLADLLIPAADLAYDPSALIAPPPDYDMLAAELHLVVARLRRLDLLDLPLAELTALRDRPSPGVAADAAEARWFEPFRLGSLTTLREAALQWRNLEDGLGLREMLGVTLKDLVHGLSLEPQAPDPVPKAHGLILGANSRFAARPYDEVGAVLARCAGQGYGNSVAGLIAAAAHVFDSIAAWGLSFTQAIGFAAYPVGAALPAEARRVARGRFGDEALWDKAIRDANNALRTTRRDRLVDWLTARHGFAGADALYAHFLVDVEMSTCMKTSRLLLAIQAVQLFAQRIFLGLEPGMRYDEVEQPREWTWMKNFRVWGAARELFLYPESYLAASLRLDKSPFFETLEEELQQGELSDERIEDCYVRYVEKVADVARLDIRAFCHDTPLPGAQPTLHVVGRTRSEPHRYFHREQSPGGVWKAWRPLEQEIDGDHLMMVSWNRRVHLLWPTFIERRLGDEDYYEILFNHMSLRNSKWTPKRKLPGKILSGRYCGPGLLNDLDRKTGKLKPHNYDNLTLNEVATMQTLTGYLYVGSYHLVLPGPNVNIPYPLTVSSKSDIQGLYPHDFRTWSDVRNEANWIPTYADKPDPDAVRDFSMASMKRKSYFFRAMSDFSVGGNLHIQVRREFAEAWEGYHTGYLEAAYEDGLRLSSDGQVTLEPVYVPPRPQGTWLKFLAARPSYTVPDAMKLRNGFDRIEERRDTPHLAGKLYAKRVPTHVGFGPDSLVLFDAVPTDYELIFEQSNEHHLFGAPFFFEDEAHSYFAAPDADDPQRYRFTSFNIPGTALYLAELNARGVAGLLAPKPDDGPYNVDLKRQQRIFDNGFPGRYAPTTRVRPLWPVEHVDFTYGAPGAPYSWEIFFHIPMRIVEALRTAGRYDRALDWISYVFDPTDQEDKTDPHRYWQVRPFYEHQPKGPIQTLMRLLSTATTPQELAEKQALLAQIAIWRDDPFDPHSVCAIRTSGYMLWAFITYVEVLIEWGDKLFRQNSRESIAEATQLYVFARTLLGERPKEVEKADAPPKTYDQIRLALDAFANTAVTVENNVVAYGLVSGANHSAPIALQAARSLYFCIPRNPKLMGLWDLVEDRLGKIRRCLNIDGLANELPLYAARIDPGLLVRARAAGMDISDVLADLAAPRAPYRFAYLIDKAQQFAGEVKGFGAAVLSAMEKRDAEELARLRSQHEISIQKAMRNVRVQQRDQARAQVASLQQNRKSVEVRMAAYAERQPMIGPEKKQLTLLQVSQGFAKVQAVLQGVSSIMHAFDAEIGVPCNSKHIRVGNIVAAIAGMAGSTASAASLSSTMAGLTAAADRRKEEWDLQGTLAGEELKQIDKQEIAAEIGVAIAELELENLDRQIEQSNEVLSFMKVKFSNKELYVWMTSRLATLHHQAYDLAFDLAKKAQAAFADELGRPDADFVRFGHWEGDKHGLLAGDWLGLQLRQLEAAYIEGNRRTYEARRPISLALLDPAALATLIADGSCEFELPEWLYDRDLPGLYDRRIKTLSLHLPCVTGPHVPVHAKLTLLSHQIRRKPNYTDAPDLRFDSIQSIVTSSGVGDTGLFETNLQDARYLPFEGCGAVARFRLEVPEFRQFDLTTLSDVIVTVSYTAREGGDLFRQQGAATLAAALSAAKPRLMMSFRHDFQDEWQKFLADGATAVTTAGTISSSTLGFKILPPAVPPEAEPYATRAQSGTFKLVQAWALTVDQHGAHELVQIDKDRVPLEGGNLFVAAKPFFGTDGLKWKPSANSRQDVVDLILIYEKS